MWKIAVGFALFAALALFILSKGGDIDMGGEKHGDTTHMDAPVADAPASVVAPVVVAPAASSAAK